jgi:hypothetical protein
LWDNLDLLSNLVRQRTIGSPARDYIPILRGAGWLRYVAGKLLGIKDWSFDEKEEMAREYRKKQQVYINEMLSGLKDRIASGDETPSILGNIFRQGLLKEEEILLASYTGSMSFFLIVLLNYHLMTARQQSLLGLTLATRSLGSSVTSPIGQTCSRTASRLSVKYTTAKHLGPMNMTVSNMLGLYTPLVLLCFPLLALFSDFMKTQEGSRIYTPVRLGFPRQTLDGATYMGHKIPRGMVCLLPGS